MQILFKKAETAFSLPVSEKEKELATAVRKEFEEVLKNLEEFDRYIKVFFDHLDDLNDKTDMAAINMLMKKYERKLKVKFNDFLSKLGDSLTHYNTMLSDTEMDNLRDLIIECAKGMRSVLVALLKIFGKVRDPDFVTEAKAIYPSMSKSIEQMRRMIKIDLFGHIDGDILGRIRIGGAQFPLTREG